MFVMLHIPEALRPTVMPGLQQGEPGKDINICLKLCLKMFVMLLIPEVLRHTVMPRTPTWVKQEKISTFV